MFLHSAPEFDPTEPCALFVENARVRVVIHELFEFVLFQAEAGEVAAGLTFVHKLGFEIEKDLEVAEVRIRRQHHKDVLFSKAF